MRERLRRVTPLGWCLVGLVVVGTGLRLWALGATRLTYDESFTAIVGRLPFDSLLTYLRGHDSHPPLDYLLHAPLARAGVSAAMFRLPSALCSVGALALFAFWMRRFGWAGAIATGVLALSAFQLLHGRDARMYAEMELVGVGAGFVADGWLREPRRWHAPAIGALVLVGMLTHVSGILLGGGLLVLAGLRTDAAAWRWRAALAAAGAGWVALWGSSFLVQASGGHSSWIPATTLPRVVTVIGELVTAQPRDALLIVAAVVAGGFVMRRRDRTLALVWLCCCVVPFAAGAAAGTVLPVLIDRTFTVAAWGVALAIGFAVEAVARRTRVAGVAVVVVALALMLPSLTPVYDSHYGPGIDLAHVAAVARPGDVAAIHPAWRRPQLLWALAVHGRYPVRPVTLPGLPNTFALAIGHGAPRRRVWLLDIGRRDAQARGYASCSGRPDVEADPIGCLVPSPRPQLASQPGPSS